MAREDRKKQQPPARGRAVVRTICLHRLRKRARRHGEQSLAVLNGSLVPFSDSRRVAARLVFQVACEAPQHVPELGGFLMCRRRAFKRVSCRRCARLDGCALAIARDADCTAESGGRPPSLIEHFPLLGKTLGAAARTSK